MTTDSKRQHPQLAEFIWIHNNLFYNRIWDGDA
jgi:hypothetical protein